MVFRSHQGIMTHKGVKSMAFYESVFIARQDISTAQVDALAAEFAEIIRKHGGQVTKTESWGLRNLAYRIKKNRKGHYVLFNLDAPAAAIAELERNLRLHEDILRFLTVQVEQLQAEPSAILKRDEGEGERRTGGGFGGSGGGSGAPRRDGSGRPPRSFEPRQNQENVA
jgi:small subunit ribosomal protein S6